MRELTLSARKRSTLAVTKIYHIHGKPQRIELSSPIKKVENEKSTEPLPPQIDVWELLNKKTQECKRLEDLLSEKEKEIVALRDANQRLEAELRDAKEVRIPHYTVPTKRLLHVINVKDRVKLYCRVRPFTKSEAKSNKYMSLLTFSDDQHLELYKPITTSNGVNNDTDTYDCSKYVFKFDKVYQPQCKQDEIFEDVRPLVQSVITGGYRVTLFAYGQTGSGKTFTIQGASATAGHHDINNTGLLHRSVQVLLSLMSQLNETEQTTETKLSMQLSCIEVYNEDVRDLVNENVQDLDHLHTLLDTCTRNRTVGVTQYNERSSRSHCLFRFRIYRGDPSNIVGVLNMIDLAGSERMCAHDDTDEMKHKETRNINSSLYQLSQVIKGMVKGETFINYRSSTLTKLLRNDLVYHNETDSRSKILMFLNIRPPLNIRDKYIDKTISSLQFAKEAHTFDIVKHKVTVT
jgi:kinesin family protein C1